MTGLLFLLLGACLTLGAVFVWAVCAERTDRREPSVETLAWVEQLRAQQRLNEVTQRTLRQMLKVVRDHQQ